MDAFIRISLFVHVLAGCLALVAGLFAIIFRRNARRHRPVGRVYYWSMAVIFVTSVYVSLYHGNVFLFFIGIFTFHSATTAYRSLRLKKLHLDQRGGRIDWTIEALNIGANAGLLILAIWKMAHSELQFALVCFVFGLIGLRLSYSNVRRLKGKVTGKIYWLQMHIGGMLGSYIGALTAFLVNNNARFIHMPEVIAWLGPTALLVPFLMREVRKAQMKKLAGSPQGPGPQSST